jgi:hypothetical protein
MATALTSSFLTSMTQANQEKVEDVPAQPGARPTIVQGGGPGSHVYTARDVAVMKARREELSRQLKSADGRRRALQNSLKGATGADKAGLEQRLAVLDSRIARLEGDIEENGQALASPGAALVSTQQDPGWTPGTTNRMVQSAVPLLMVFMIFVLAPIAMGIGRTLWKRASQPRPAVSPETAQRLERMEQAMDAIAVEVERVSEGQRFVTRILSEGRTEALLAAEPAMQPVRVAVNQGPQTAR